MKKFFVLLLCLNMIISLCACGEKQEAEVVAVSPVPVQTQTQAPAPAAAPTAEPEPTPEPTPVPIQPELPPVVDDSLNAILDSVVTDVRPGSSGTSLRAAQCAARLLDWGMGTTLTDDEIYSAVGSWLDMQSDENLLIFFESFFAVYDASYDLRAENGRDLLETAGISSSAYPWNDQAARAVEMVCYGCGLR